MTAPDRRPVCMITHSYYDEDPRVRREAESLVANGIPVDVFALRRPGDPSRATLQGVEVTRLNVQRHQGAGLATYLLEYLAFLGRATVAVAAAHRRRRYRLAQVHTLPDVLVLAAIPLKLAGVPVVLDLHEAMPEFFRQRFGPRLGGPRRVRIAERLLLLQERVSIAIADAVITVNDVLADLFVGRGVSRSKITVLLNTPALDRFDPDAYPTRGFREDGVLRLVYAGALTPIYELDVVLEAIARVRVDRPALQIHLDCYGRGDDQPALEEHATRLGLDDRVCFHGRAPIEAIPAAIAAADVGLAPTRRTAFTDFSLSTKLFEYAAMGKPVVASRLPSLARYFPPGELWTYEPGDADGLASALLRLVDAGDARSVSITAALERTRELAWDRQLERYLELLRRLGVAPPAG
jgi:glycosyltransferase involved in cell wall biosynthesis